MGIEVKIGDDIITLTEEQKKFCELYAYSEMRGNGVQCYALAYGTELSEPGGYNVAKSGAHENLTKPYILSYIRSLYATTLNDETVDNELAFLVSQNADFGAKLGAIKEFNQLKGRIIKKIDHKSDGEKIQIVTIFELPNDGRNP